MPSVRVRLTNSALIFGRRTTGSEAADQAALDTLLYAQHKYSVVSDDPASPEAFGVLVKHLQWCGWELLSPVETSAVYMGDPRHPSGDELERAVERFFGDEVTRAVLGSRREPINAFFRQRSAAPGRPATPGVRAGGGRSIGSDPRAGTSAGIRGAGPGRATGGGGPRDVTAGERTPPDRPEVEGAVLCIRRSDAGGQPQAKVATFRMETPRITVRCASLRLSLPTYQTKKEAISAFLRQEIEDQVQDLDF